MKRTTIGVTLGLVLSLVLGAPIALAEDPPHPSMTFTDIKLKDDFSKIKIRAELSLFTLAPQEDFLVCVGLANNANGESAFTCVDLGTGEVTAGGGGTQVLTITTVKLKKKKGNLTEIKLKVDIGGMTPTQLSDVTVSLGIQNTVNGENAFAQGPAATITVPD